MAIVYSIKAFFETLPCAAQDDVKLYVVKDNFEPLILPPNPHRCWDYIHWPPYMAVMFIHTFSISRVNDWMIASYFLKNKK